jgi:hypothetical protein
MNPHPDLTDDAAPPGPPSISKPTVDLTPVQRRTFEELFAFGDRPTMHPGLPESLAARIETGTAEALSRWTESRLYLTKSGLLTALNCEGLLVAQRAQPFADGMIPSVAVGNVAHHAIQISATHVGHPPASYVNWAIDAAKETDERFSQMWQDASPAKQSDLMQQMISRTTAFLDSFPPLDPVWTPQFEVPLQAKIGKLTLSARPDLMLGRPRTDSRQSMLVVDFKTGGLHDGHELEAALYALVCTLRYGVAPYRSTVLSLASGEWTAPDVTSSMLEDIADKVIDGVNKTVDVLAGRREPELTPDAWCRFCPAAPDCDAYAAHKLEQAG